MSTAVFIKGEICELVYNEILLLPSRECNFGINIGRILNNWGLKFIFIDSASPNNNLSSIVTDENGGKTIVFTQYGWLGDEIENRDYHYIESTTKNVRAYIKIRSSANLALDSRRAHVCIWKVK